MDKKIVWIHGMEDNQGEFIQIVKCLDHKNGRYQIKPRLNDSYKKSETIIQSICLGRVDEDGRYDIPIPKDIKDGEYLSVVLNEREE